MEKMLENLKEDAELPKSFIDLHQDDDGIWVGEMDKNKPTDAATSEQLNQASGNLEEQARPNQGEDLVESVPESADMGTKNENKNKSGTYQEWNEIRDGMVKERAVKIYNEKNFDSEYFQQERIKKMKDKHPEFANLSDEESLNKCNWLDAVDEIDKEFEEETEKKFWDDEEYRKKHNQIKISWMRKKEVDKADNVAPVKKPEEELSDKKEEIVAGVDTDKKEVVKKLVDKKKEISERAMQLRNEKYGDNHSSVGWKLLKNFGNSAGSIVGARVAWEGRKLWKDWRRKSAVGNITENLMEESRTVLKKKGISAEEIKLEAEKIKQERERNETLSHIQTDEMLRSKRLEPGSDDAHEFMMKWDRKEAIKRLKKEKGADKKVEEKVTEGRGPVREKIRALEGKLKKAKISPEDKRKVRDHLASILKDYRHKEKESGDDRTRKIERVLDTYMSNKAQALLVAKEALNTASIIAIAPWLRLGGYAAFAGLERGAKAMNAYDKEHFNINKDKESHWVEKGKTVLKDVFWNSFKETARGASFNTLFKEKEKGGWAKGGEFVSSFFTALRFVGLAEYGAMGYMGKLPTQDYDKLKEMIVDVKSFRDVGNVALQAGQNWFGNLERLAGYAGIDLHKHLESAAGYLGYDMKSGGGGANGAVDYEKFNKVFGTGPRGEVPSAEEIQRVQISSVFGADSPIAHKIMEGGVTQDEARLVGSLNELGLRAVDLHNFQGAPGDLSHLVDQVSKLNLGVSQPGILKELISNPIAAKNFNNQAVQDILAKGKFSSEHIKDILSAKHIARIDKPGGSISEALHKAMGQNDKVTVVNPDGKILHNFDANLAHRGDTVVQGADGSITVFKTSDVSVKAGQSLEKVYTDIAGKLDKAGVPNEVRERFNEGVGYWGEKITHGESEKMLHWWDENKATYDHLTPEKQQEILRNIHSAKSDAEAGKMLNDIANAPAHSVAETVAPATEVVTAPAESVPNLAKEWKDESAQYALHGGRKNDLLYPDIKDLQQREELRKYLNDLHKQTGFQPRGDQETVGEYMKRTRNYIDGQEVLKADLRHTPEAIPNTASWPPAAGRSGADRIHFNPYSDAVGQGAEVNVIKTSDNIRLGGDRAVVNHITGIFGEKKAQFSVPADLDKISAWKEVRDQLAGDVINGKLNKPSVWFSWLSGHKKQEQYDNLRKYLEDLKGKHNVNPVNKETVGDYVKRAEEWLSRKRAGEGDYNPNIELK